MRYRTVVNTNEGGLMYANPQELYKVCYTAEWVDLRHQFQLIITQDMQ